MLYKHQLDIIRDDPHKTGLFLGTGSGKTLIALSLARGRTLVICPKTQKLDGNWEREVKKNNLKVDLTVMSKEEFRRDWEKLEKFDTIIIDEAHTCLGVTPNVRWVNKKPIPKASQLFDELESYVNHHKPKRSYLCTATIIRSPMTVWGAARILGFDWDFYKFRDKFYVRLPMPGREVWRAKEDSATKDALAGLVRRLGYTGRLEDYFDVPSQVYKTIHVELMASQKKRIKEIPYEYPDPIVRVGKIHQIENGSLTGDEFSKPEEFENTKIDVLLDLALEFPKMIVFAKYKAQIAQIQYELMKAGHNVIVMTGDTQDRSFTLDEVKRASQYVFIVQAQISAGWEVPGCPVVIFASRTYSFVDYSQALGRVQRANNIKKNLYINLVTKGGVDQAVDKCLVNKQDFSDRIYADELE